METTHDELRAWLRRVLEQTGDTPTSLARKAGLAQSTLTRFLNSDDKSLLGLRSIARIAHVTGSQPPNIKTGPVARRPPLSRSADHGFAEPEAAPYHVQASDPSPLQAAVDAAIANRNAVDPWRVTTRSLEDIGVLPGDVLVVDLNAKPATGDLVCAQVYQWSVARAETVFRVYDPPYLLAASRDPAFRKPLFVDNDRVVIKGVVCLALRDCRASAPGSPPHAALP